MYKLFQEEGAALVEYMPLIVAVSLFVVVAVQELSAKVITSSTRPSISFSNVQCKKGVGFAFYRAEWEPAPWEYVCIACGAGLTPTNVFFETSGDVISYGMGRDATGQNKVCP